MKVALVFIVLIGMVVIGLPFSISGDSSLTGAVQSFISYAMTATGVLLSMLTIFMSRSLSDEFVKGYIFLVVSKPIPRWQFAVGKWLGITVLNAAFLSFSGLAVYGMVHYIRLAHPPINKAFDEQELRNEVLVARHAVKVTPPDFTRPAAAEFERNVEEGIYANAPDLNLAAERARLARKYEARWRLVGPLQARRFDFGNILCDRSPGNRIQLRYKAVVSRFPPDEVFRCAWQFGNPLKGTPVYSARRKDVVGRYHTIRVPADAVADDHTLTARFLNQTPFDGEQQYPNVIEFRKADEVEVLFVVGSFEGNLLRVLILLMCKLMFLGGVALLMATLFSFPVACLASFTVYVLAGARAFLSESLDWVSDGTVPMFDSFHEFAVRSIAYVYNALHWVLPDFSYYDPVESFVSGRNVGLVWVLQGVAELVLLKGAIVLGLAVVLFHRREVAEISV